LAKLFLADGAIASLTPLCPPPSHLLYTAALTTPAHCGHLTGKLSFQSEQLCQPAAASCDSKYENY